LDYKISGSIVDDDIHDIMVKHLPAGVKLTAIFDSCHSGTAMDLPYIYTPSGLQLDQVATSASTMLGNWHLLFASVALFTSQLAVLVQAQGDTTSGKPGTSTGTFSGTLTSATRPITIQPIQPTPEPTYCIVVDGLPSCPSVTISSSSGSSATTTSTGRNGTATGISSITGTRSLITSGPPTGTNTAPAATRSSAARRGLMIPVSGVGLVVGLFWALG